MPKTPTGPRPDPMTREVDRLLAQLARAGAGPERENGALSVTSSGKRRFVGVAHSTEAPTRADLIGLWARVLLGIALGAVMTQWPYPHGCDLPLAGYLGAVAMVVVAGGWIAFSSWRMRSGVPHVLSLMLVFWGIVLTAEQLLPRIGYAAEQAAWRCGP
jgi:hypothetical protein